MDLPEGGVNERDNLSLPLTIRRSARCHCPLQIETPFAATAMLRDMVIGMTDWLNGAFVLAAASPAPWHRRA
jgi:hypothetical protein